MKVQQELMRHAETTFDRVHDVATHKFIAESDSMFNLSDVLLARLLWTSEDDETSDWLAEIRKGLSKLAIDLHATLRRALDVVAVSYVFHQAPQIMPDFL